MNSLFGNINNTVSKRSFSYVNQSMRFPPPTCQLIILPLGDFKTNILTHVIESNDLNEIVICYERERERERKERL